MARPIWLTYFDDLPEPRVQRTRRHTLSDIVLMVLIGAMVDCPGWDAIHRFIRFGSPELQALFEFRRGVPSADTLRRVMRALDPAAFRNAFIGWAQSMCVSTEGKLVAIDGKTVRGAKGSTDDNHALHLVNAWVSENAMTLGQLATSTKSNEITAIPQLLKLLDLRGAVVTIDAMGCQKEIAEVVREKGADYLFGLKGNHPTLQAEVRCAFDEQTCTELAQSSETFHEAADKGHGRNELRRTWVLRDLTWLSRAGDWRDLKTLVLVEAHRTRKDVTSVERRVYISSLDASAERMSALVRGHWNIENRLHWILDVTFGEDRARVRDRNAAENLSLFRKAALNLLQRAPFEEAPDLGIAARKRLATYRPSYLMHALSAGLPEFTAN
jgi:predicted transposase YbfD/YdcC